MKRHPKFFEAEIKKLLWNITVDRLKPASLEAIWLSIDTSVTLPPSVAPNVLKETVTRYGCHIRWPKHLLN